MIELDSDLWGSVQASPGGDGRLTAELLRQLAIREDENAWSELHHQINHQGTVGETAYLAAPHIVAIARRSGVHMRALLLSTLGSVVASRECYGRSAAPLRPEWRSVFEAACREAQTLAAETAAQPIDSDDDSLALVQALAAFHGHANLAMLLDTGPRISCPECGEYIEFREA